MKIIFPLIVTFLFNTFLFSQTEEHYFRFQIKDVSEVDRLTKMISIDKLDHTYVYAYANDKQWIEINATDYKIEVLPHPSSLYEHKTAHTLDDIQEWDTFPSYPLYITLMQQYADSFPQICRLDTFGYSVNGKLLLVVKISDNVNMEEDEPEFFYTSTMHGDETVGYVLMLRLIDYLLHQYGEVTPEGFRATHLINNMEIWVNPLANPDGTYRLTNDNVNSAWRGNANGTDLNRDFPDRINDPVNTPIGREPETQAMMTLAADHNFNLSANFHGGAQVVNYPWDNGAPSGSYSACPDDSWFIDVCLKYASTNPDMLNGGFPNGITNGCEWYSIYGGRQDWIYYWHGGRETTIELWDTKNPSGSVLPQRWTNNKESFLSYMEQTFKGVRGVVTDVITGEPIWVQVDVEGYAEVPIYTDPEVGDFHRMLLPGTYTLYVRAPFYATDTLYNVTVVDTGATKINAALQTLPNNRIAGQVVLTDTGYYGGVTIEVQDQSITTNSSGYFEFENIYAGDLQVLFSKPGYFKTLVDTSFDALSELWLEVELNPSEYRILLIDDDGGERSGLWVTNRSKVKKSSRIENVFNRSQSANLVEVALNLAGFEVIRENSSATDPLTWQDYDLLFWTSGADLSPISSSTLQNGLVSYAQSNLPLIIEGGEIGYEFRGSSSSTFRDNVLHYSSWVTDNAGNLSVQNAGHPIAQGLPPTITLSYSGYGDQDAVTLASGSQLILSNSLQSNTAGLLLNNQHIFCAFNLAAINQADASQLIANSANYFLPISQISHDVALYEITGIIAGDFIQSGNQIPITLTIRNYGTDAEPPGTPVEISIEDDNNNVVYSAQTLTTDSLFSDSTLDVFVGDWTVLDTTANLVIRASIQLGNDERTGNNTKTIQITSLSNDVIFTDNFEFALDSLSWKIVTAGNDSAINSWHLSYLPAMGRYSMRVNPNSVNKSQEQWLISSDITNATELFFYWDYGAVQIQDTLLILSSFTDDSLQSFTDTLLEINSGYPYPVNHFDKLNRINLNSETRYIAFIYKGKESYWAVDNIGFSSLVTSITQNSNNLPQNYSLLPNYPNPFNPSTTIQYSLPTASKIKLTIFNILGEEVTILFEDYQQAGIHLAEWDGKNRYGIKVASGIYFYRLNTPEFSYTRKMSLVK